MILEHYFVSVFPNWPFQRSRTASSSSLLPLNRIIQLVLNSISTTTKFINEHFLFVNYLIHSIFAADFIIEVKITVGLNFSFSYLPYTNLWNCFFSSINFFFYIQISLPFKTQLGVKAWFVEVSKWVWVNPVHRLNGL